MEWIDAANPVITLTFEQVERIAASIGFKVEPDVDIDLDQTVSIYAAPENGVDEDGEIIFPEFLMYFDENREDGYIAL